MGKIIITERQYQKIKSVLINNVISKKYLNEAFNAATGQYTVGMMFDAENATDSNKDELRMFKNAIFTYSPSFETDKKLISDTTIQMVDSYTGTGGSNLKTKVFYFCGRGKFMVSGSKEKYFIESDKFKPVLNQLTLMCTAGNKASNAADKRKKDKLQYHTKNPNVLTDSNSTKITVPTNTSFTFIDGKNGVAFRSGTTPGWFDCGSSKFNVNSVIYTSKYLAQALITHGGEKCRPSSVVKQENTGDIEKKTGKDSNEKQYGEYLN